jgi:hypothetical protein
MLCMGAAGKMRFILILLDLLILGVISWFLLRIYRKK